MGRLLRQAFNTYLGIVSYQGLDSAWPLGSPYGIPAALAADAPAAGQQVAMMSYLDPTGDQESWRQLEGYPKEKISVVVVNQLDGPDTQIDQDWKTAIDRVAKSGKTVLGYVRTGYLGAGAANAVLQTRLGSADANDWVAQIERDVDLWYTHYGDSIGGIFFDEAWTECGPSNLYAELYALLNRYTKEKHPNAFTVLNPGGPVPECFKDAMDTLLTFSGNYTTYKDAYVPNPWAPTDMRRLWHLIDKVPEAQVAEVTALALSRGAGLVEMTAEDLDNPDAETRPATASYIQAQIQAVPGGTVLKSPAQPWPAGAGGEPATPLDLEVNSTEYSSAALTWLPAANAVAYKVRLDDGDVAMVAAHMTHVTIGNLALDSTNVFTVVAVGADGKVSGASNPVTAKTMPLPNGSPVTNAMADVAKDRTVFRADVLLYYPFVRVFIWDRTNCDLAAHPSYAIQFKDDKYVCAQYMVEGTTLYQYNGTGMQAPTQGGPASKEASKDTSWSWKEVPEVPVIVDIVDYTWTWIVPLGTAKTATRCFLVETEGYNPPKDEFTPDPLSISNGLC